MMSLPLSWMAFFIPVVFSSSLGLKGHKEVSDHAVIDVPLHQQVVSNLHCAVHLGDPAHYAH